MVGIAHSGQHQQLRRVDGSAGQDNLPVGHLASHLSSAVDVFDADGADAVEKNAADLGPML
jgi:hypothetical protein